MPIIRPGQPVTGGIIRDYRTDPTLVGGPTPPAPDIPPGLTGSWPIELVSAQLFWDDLNTSYAATFRYIDPADWNHIVRARFQVSAEIRTTATSPQLIQLVDENDTVYATVVFSPLSGMSAGTYAVLQSVDFEFTEAHYYGVRMLGNPDFSGSAVNQAHIVFDTVEATKVVSSRPMIIAGDSTGGFAGTVEKNQSFAWSVDRFANGVIPVGDYGYSGETNGQNHHSLWEKNEAAFATVSTYRLVVTAWHQVYEDNDHTYTPHYGTGFVALFNKTTNAKVAGTELTWDYVDQVVVIDSEGHRQGIPTVANYKSVDFPSTATNFTDLNEFEVRFYTTASINGTLPDPITGNGGDDYGLFVIGHADIEIVLNPASKAEIYWEVIHLNGAELTLNSLTTELFLGATFFFETSKAKVTSTSPSFGFRYLGYTNIIKAGAAVRVITGLYYGGYAGHHDLVDGGTNWDTPDTFLPVTSGPEPIVGRAGWHLPGTLPIPASGTILDINDNPINIGTIFYPMGSATVGIAYWGPATASGTNQTAEVTLHGFQFDSAIDPLEVITSVSLYFDMGWPRPDNPGPPYSDVSVSTNAIVNSVSLATHTNSVPSQYGIEILPGPFIWVPFPITAIDVTADRSWVYTDFTQAAFEMHMEITNPNTEMDSGGPPVLFFLDGTVGSYRPRVVIEVTQPCSFFETITNTERTVTRVPVDIISGSTFALCYNLDQFTIGFVVVSVEGGHPLSEIIVACPSGQPEVGAPYSFTFEVTGGTAPYHWELVDGAFPPGLILNGDTGLLSGTPTEFFGTYTFTVRVTDVLGLTAYVTCTFLAAPPTISVACPTTQPEFGVPYTFTMTAVGGLAPYTWRIISGSLPLGLTLDANTGTIAGVAIEAGHFMYTIQVMDATGATATATCTESLVGSPHNGIIIPCTCDAIIGVIYEMSSSFYTDAGCTIRRLRRSPHVSDEMQWFFYDMLQVDMETGVGLVEGQGSDPQVMMRFSDDGGRTWSNEEWRSAGALGAFSRRVIWRHLGRGRDRLFEIVTTDPVKIAFIDGYLRLRKGR